MCTTNSKTGESVERMKHYFAGVDIGSVSTKAVMLDSRGEVIARDIRPAGPDSGKAATESLSAVQKQSTLPGDYQLTTVSTGYGRVYFAEADREVSEISCHARGLFRLYNRELTIVDIGGQDSKVIHVNNEGRVDNFVMNDKCAAGTGRFLEVMAGALQVDLEAMGREGLQATSKLEISNMCTVFAESEVIGLIARGEKRADIVDAIHRAVSGRIYALARRTGIAGTVVLTGGVALNSGIHRALESLLGETIFIPEYPQFSGALGAALYARDLNREH